MVALSYSDIINRANIRTAKEDKSITESAELCWKQYKDKPSNFLANKMIDICSKNPVTANEYVSETAEVMCGDIDSNMKRKYIENIIPMIENKYESYVSSRVKYMNIPKKDQKQIKEQLVKNRNCDRIYENHTMISKGINIDDRLIRNNYQEALVFECAKAVKDSFLPSYGMVNVTIEESLFLMNKYGMKPNKKLITETAANYFLLKTNDLRNDLNRMSSSIRENAFLNEDYSDLPAPTPMERDSEQVLVAQPPTQDDIDTMLDVLCTDVGNLEQNFAVFFKALRTILVASDDDSLCEKIYAETIPAVYDRWTMSDIPNMDTVIEKAMSCIKLEIEDNIPQYISGDDQNIKDRFTFYQKALSGLYENLHDLINNIYPQYNIDNMQNPVQTESTEAMSLDEFKVFKFNNLITIGLKIDKYFRNKMKPNRLKFGKVMKKIRSKLFEDATVYDAITEDGNIDYTVCSFEYDPSQVDRDLQREMVDCCKEINSSILAGTTMKCYYEICGDTIEFRVKDSNIVKLTESELEELHNHTTPEDRYRLASILYEYEILKEANSNGKNSSNPIKKMDNKIYGNVNKATNTIRGKINGSNDNNSKNNSQPSDNERETFNKSMSNLNKIKLDLMGAAKWGKDTDAKIQQNIKNADVDFGHFIADLKNAFFSDKREDLVKGRVLPSFKRVMNWAILLAGQTAIGFIKFKTGPAAFSIAAITALGGFICSKHASRKEKLLALDEIEVELQMIDKEIEKADSEGKLKRERALMMEKKNLQRQYQRIKYNARKGKDMLPNSAIGVPGNN